MVKRIAIVALSLIFVISVAALSFSAEKEQPMKHMGTVSAIDAKAKTVTIKDAKGHESTMTQVDEKTIAGLKVGDEVECMHVMKEGKAVCKGMKKVKSGAKPKTGGY
jgi:ABC-type enterochelin transport system substrate-binding protein